MSAIDDIRILLKARTQCIWVQTFEEQRFIDTINKLIRDEFVQFKLHVYSLTQGLARIPQNATSSFVPNFDAAFRQPQKLIEHINELQNKDKKESEYNIFVLRDYDDMFTKAEVIRSLRDIKSKPRTSSYAPIIILSPTVDVPQKLQKMFQIVTFDLPSKDDISLIVKGTVASMKKNAAKLGSVSIPTEDEQEKIVQALCGLTNNEIIDILMRSIQKYNALEIEAITEEKINAVKKSGVLSYTVPKVSMKDIGGNDVFKEWFEDVKACFRPEARELNIPLQMGYLALGLPGTCKSIMAEAVAKELNVPMISLDLSSILAGLVGRSEANIKFALDTVRQMAPCVLFVDEVEKMIGGISSSNQSDSGVVARIVGSLLNFMTEDNGVFTVMTSNDVSQLPPELIRPGRLDTQWYFGLPNKEERKEIIKIHLNKYNQNKFAEDDDAMTEAVERTSNYTGAEIELAVKMAVRKAYKRFITANKKPKELLVSKDEFLSSVSEVVTVFKYNNEQCLRLEQYAKNRTRYTSSNSSANSTNNEVDDEIIAAVVSGQADV